MANPVQHGDFGEKIGGAKKDLWQQRGLLSDDLSAMNEREADKYVKKDNVWKKPDYQAMIGGGMPVGAAYFIKTVRDSLATAPAYLRGDVSPESRLARQKEYIDTVREVQAVMEGVKTEGDVPAAFSRCMVDNGYFERTDGGTSGPRYHLTDKGKRNHVITNKLIEALHISGEAAYARKIIREAEKKQFGVPKEDKVPPGYEIRFNDGKYIDDKNSDWKQDTYYVAKSHRILHINFGTRAAALQWAQEHARQRGADGKLKFVPPQLQHVRRDGPDYRRGRNMEGRDYLGAFGFKGGEFGNWMSQADRQASLNMGFEALKDLAAALKISDRDISYQGELSIAFGARGSGNAVAHYEPLRQVINLTKMRGAGSLAHEWWHGLDDFLGRKMGANGLLSESPHRHPLFKKLMDTIQYKPETPDQAAARAGAADARTARYADNWLKQTLLPTINRYETEAEHIAFETLRNAYLHGEPGSVDKLNDLKKSLTGHVIPKEDRDRLHSFERILRGINENTEISIGKVQTDYYEGSREMGSVCMKDGGYWESNTELTARAFATYVADRLPGRSDYLAGHAECAVAMTSDREGNPKIIKAYPEGEERKAINAVFDEIVAELKAEHHLTHDGHIRPEPVSTRPAPDIPSCIQEPAQAGPSEQLSLFVASERPSAMDKLAAAKEAVAKNDAERSPTGKAKDKPHEPAL